MAISEKLRKKLEKAKEGLQTGNYDTFIFKEGTTRVRILNPGDDEDFAFPVVQFFMGKDNGGAIISPATFGEPCAIMEAYKELKAGDEDEKELAEKFFPSTKYAIPMVRYKDEKGKELDTEAGAKLGMCPKTIYDSLLDFALDEEYDDEFFHPLKGCDIKIKKSGSGKTGTKYTAMRQKESKLPKEFRGVYNPEEMVRALIPTYEQTQKYINSFLGISDDDDETKKSKKKGSKEKGSSKDKKKKGKKRTSDM